MKELTEMKRRTAREKAMQSLFQLEINETDTEHAIAAVLGTAKSDPFLTMLVEEVSQSKTELDALINQHLENWTLDRIATTEKIILRISVYEINYLEDVPNSVSINEAVELAKKYGNDKSGQFVNGVLSKIIRE